MNSITHTADGVHSKHQTANKTNAASAKSALRSKSVSDRGGNRTEPNDKTLLFSPELAKAINPNRPDITAAVILYGLYTWQKSSGKSAFSKRPTIDGKPACYQSLRQLEAEYPWWADNSILKAINRAEKALKGHFKKKRGDDCLHYHLSDKLIKAYKFTSHRGGLISFKKSEAIKYGVLEAILISNLRYILDPSRNSDPVMDAAGNIYRELSPTKLTKEVVDKNGDLREPIPVSDDTVSKALHKLIVSEVIMPHCKKGHFYTLVDGMKLLPMVPDKVSSNPDKVSTFPDKVSSKSEIAHHKSVLSNDLQVDCKTLDRNRDRKEDRKCLLPQTSTLRVNVCGDESKVQ